MEIAALTDVGLARENNQDSFFASANSEFPLFIIADGMGGHKAGEKASSMAVDIIKNKFSLMIREFDVKKDINLLIKSSIKKANEKIYLKSLERLEYQGMGTTITLAYILDNYIYIGNVGDSRAYYISKDEILQITEDHSLVNELVKNGSITNEEAKTHPQKNVITRAVGTSNNVKIDTYKYKYEMGDFLLLCSDGLTNMVDEMEILNIINGSNSLVDACQRLISMAKNNGGFDNITVVAIKF
ncbi:Stp1/IreP family PP2C-type Ser/Thr phosphatase [Wansuia hejianensis]|uniref:protein-serine/threonine phosphatase n=1 Tax=Wansuia hejianensis TaxID=2763667 RepID=A0A926ILS5_9FIRM|nr:Stp1/IreP family PP2C-type Ser/Thr phosphatase [Wansuia hejianensis]MBC8590459.1 Stp1/IreP family PP2C-type Ser/Thr phosphatase [Wansuia hejianensis]